MASLTGQTVSSTYDGLLKTDDNDILGAAPKEITDGLGNGSGMTLSTTGDVSIAGDLTVDGAILDSNGVPGASGQILSSTVTGTDWVDLSEISGVDGSGTANYIAKWTDGDTIGNSVIYDNGTNVGIGTSSPIANLQIGDYTGVSRQIALASSTTGNCDILFGDGAASNSSYRGVVRYDHTGENMQFWTASTERMRIDSSGNIGINTSNPSDKLSVYTNTDYGNNSEYANATIGLGNASYPVSIRSRRYGGSFLNGLDFYYNNGTPQLGMRIDSSGNVGIGTSPAEKLSVQGAIISTGGITGHGANRATLSQEGANGAFLQSYGANTSTYGSFAFRQASSDFSLVRTPLIIDSSGRVGIGTSSPAAKLDVEGLMLNGSTNPSIMDGGNLRKKLEWNGALNSFGVYNTTNAGVDWQTNLLVNSAGNVGIGLEPYTSSGLLNLKGSGLALKNDLNGGSNNWSLIQNQATATGASIDFISGQGLAMTIAHNKNVGIGTSSPTGNLHVNGTGVVSLIAQSSGSDAVVRLINTTASTGKNYYISSTNAGNLSFVSVTDGERMRIASGGDLHVDGDVIAYSTTISDQRLKDDIQTIDNALDKVSNLRGVSYTWNNGNRKGQKDLGLIAQEVEQVLPELVREKEMPMIDGGTYKTVDYEKIVGVLIEAVKELKQEIEILKAK